MSGLPQVTVVTQNQRQEVLYLYQEEFKCVKPVKQFPVKYMYFYC